MTTRETAKTLGVSVRTVRYWLNKGIIVGEYKGRSYDISKEEVERKEKERAYTGR